MSNYLIYFYNLNIDKPYNYCNNGAVQQIHGGYMNNQQFDEILKTQTKEYEKALTNPTQFWTDLQEKQKVLFQELQGFAGELPNQTMQYLKDQYDRNQEFATKFSKEILQSPLNFEQINTALVDYNSKNINNNLEILKNNSQKMTNLVEKISSK